MTKGLDWPSKGVTEPGRIVVNRRSGDLEPLLEPAVIRGGERGDATVTDGRSVGVARRSIDKGRERTGFGGVPDRSADGSTLWGVPGLELCLDVVELHAE